MASLSDFKVQSNVSTCLCVGRGGGGGAGLDVTRGVSALRLIGSRYVLFS